MVFYKNAQWAVTEWGLEAARRGHRPNTLSLLHQLLERGGIGHGELYDWPLHLAEKTWINIDAFNEAFAEALKHHKGKYPWRRRQEDPAGEHRPHAYASTKLAPSAPLPPETTIPRQELFTAFDNIHNIGIVLNFAMHCSH